MKKKIMTLIVGLMFLSTATCAFAENVFVTENGKKYHVDECPLIKNKNPHEISKKEALEKGLGPCAKCFKESLSSSGKKEAAKVASTKKSKKEIE